MTGTTSPRVTPTAGFFFRILRLYLVHFRGQPRSPFQLMGVAPEPKSEAWRR